MTRTETDTEPKVSKGKQRGASGDRTRRQEVGVVNYKIKKEKKEKKRETTSKTTIIV
jgi:hypothetical protein